MSTGQVLLGTLTGFAIGAITGILFAPDKGSATRKQIMDKSDDYAHELKSKYEELRDSLNQKIESTKRDAEGLMEKGRAKYDDAKQDIKSASSNFKRDDTTGVKHATT